MNLLGIYESKLTKNKNGENVPHLEIVELLLNVIHCNLVDNNYQQNSRIIHTFVPNKPFGSLLEISLPNHIFFYYNIFVFKKVIQCIKFRFG